MSRLSPKIYTLKKGSFQLSYTNPVNKKRKRKVFKTKREAIEYQNKLEASFFQRDMSFFVDLPVGKLIEIHLKECPNSQLTSRKKPFREFYDEFSRNKLHEVTTTRLRHWFESIEAKHGYRENTLLHIKIMLTHFFRWLVEERIIEHSPLKPIKFKRRVAPKKARIFFSVDEVRQILDNASKWKRENYDLEYFYPFLYTLVHTGARRSELLKLLWSDVDFELNTLTFRQTKVGDDRSIVMSKHLRELIESLPRNGEHVFTNRLGQPIYMNMASRHLECFREDHPMPNKDGWGFHSLRHSFAYNYLKSGGEMYQLQAILGHYRITSTIDTYGRLRASDVENPSPYDF